MSKAIAWMFSRLEALLGWKKVPMGLVGADYLGNPQCGSHSGSHPHPLSSHPTSDQNLSFSKDKQRVTILSFVLLKMISENF